MDENKQCYLLFITTVPIIFSVIAILNIIRRAFFCIIIIIITIIGYTNSEI
jgi:hypothetical protein